MTQRTLATGEKPIIYSNKSNSINTYHTASLSRKSDCFRELSHPREETKDSQQLVKSISPGNGSVENPSPFSNQDIGFSADDLAELGIHNRAQDLDFRRESHQVFKGHRKTSVCVPYPSIEPLFTGIIWPLTSAAQFVYPVADIESTRQGKSSEEASPKLSPLSSIHKPVSLESKPKPPSRPYQASAVTDTAVAEKALEFSSRDFELSSQDCREINF